MAILLTCFAFLGGFLLPGQTLANSRLSPRLGSDPAAALSSLVTASLLLGLGLAATGGQLLPTATNLAELPWWLWLGGPLSVIGLVGTIAVFRPLGAVETALWPMLGSVLGSLAIDQFGLFAAPVLRVDATRAAGALALLAGMVLAVAGRRAAQIAVPAGGAAPGGDAGGSQRGPWRAVAFGVGVVAAAQVAVSGKLGAELGSPVSAAFIGYLLGALVLGVLVGGGSIAERKALAIEVPRPLRSALRPAWIWMGGPIAVVFVLGLTASQPVLGTGVTMMLNVTGQIASSIAIDHVGLAGTPVARVSRAQAAGLALMLGGLALIQLL